jgi:hypothetical protein
MTEPLTPQREAEILAGRTEYRSTADLDRDITDLHAELGRVRAELARYVGVEPTVLEEMAYISGCLIAVQDVCRQAKRAGNRWVSVATVEQAVDGERPDDPDDNRHRLYIDGRGQAWISTRVEGGVEYVVPVQPAVWVEGSIEEIAAETGGLREIGRCW